MRILVVGMMQGSLSNGIHDQEYRRKIANIIKQVLPKAEIIDPDGLHPKRLSYNYAQARNMFLNYVEEAKKVDLIVAYISEASMGTAIEMWEAYKAGVPILSISPLFNNWVVKLFSNRIFSGLDEFANFVRSRGLNKVIKI